MDLETAVKFAQLGFVVAQAIVVVFMLVMRGTFASKKDLTATDARAERAHHRLDLVDEKLKQLPTSRDINALGDKVSAMATDLRENSVRVEAAVLGVKRIEDYMIQGAKA